MRTMSFSKAIEDALLQAMTENSRVIIIGEDVHTLRLKLFARFGPGRIYIAPISEAAFVGAAVGAAMAGLRPVVEVMLVDFIGVAMDALLNHAAKTKVFSGGKWNVPLVLRVSCGGGYGDGGQHEQSLWGWLAHIPGLSVVVPSNPADAGGLMISAIEYDEPVVYLEHKLLSEDWLDYMGKGGRSTVGFDVPAGGAVGMVPNRWEPVPLGNAFVRKEGSDATLVSLGVGVYRCLEAADLLEKKGVSVCVIDLRTVAPLDKDTIIKKASQSQCLLVVDEDYNDFGLSGEIAAVVLESGVSVRYGRVCTSGTIPYSRRLEDEVLPNVKRIVDSVTELLT